jgi:hypothetical protein
MYLRVKLNRKIFSPSSEVDVALSPAYFLPLTLHFQQCTTTQNTTRASAASFKSIAVKLAL